MSFIKLDTNEIFKTSLSNFVIFKPTTSMKLFKFLEGLVGFGNLRLRRSKVIPQPNRLLSLSQGGEAEGEVFCQI